MTREEAMSDPVARARELLAAATPGPWDVSYAEDGRIDIDATNDAKGTYYSVVDEEGIIAADATLIAAAPTLLAELADRCEVQEREIERLRKIEAAARGAEFSFACALIDGMSLPLDMQPSRARLLRSIRRLESALTTDERGEG